MPVSSLQPPSRRALIVKLGQIGDVVMAVAGVRALYETGYAIDWACGNAARPLLASYSWIRVLPVDDAAIFHGTWMQRAWAVGSLWRQTVGRSYDLCATLYYDRRFHLLTRPVRARRKLALFRGDRSQELLAGRHHADEYLRVLLGAEDGCQETSIAPMRPDRLPHHAGKVEGTAPRIALSPGGTRNVVGEQILRRWPVENYAAVARQLLARGWEVVLLGSAEDAWVRSSFQHLGVTDWIGHFSLPELISACDTCDAVITHDTGSLHLAGLSRACVIGIFGPTDPSTRVPRRQGVVGIWGGQDFACRPCYDGRDFAPCRFNGCMHQVSPDGVLRELDLVLAQPAASWRVVHS